MADTWRPLHISYRGLPDQKVLNNHAKAIFSIFNKHFQITIDTDNDNNDNILSAFFCAEHNQWYLTLEEIEAFLQKNTHNYRSTLNALKTILVDNGAAGMRFWLDTIKSHLQNQEAALKALSIQVPLKLTRFALN